MTSAFSGGSSKRRLPTSSSFGAASNARDPKSRRREDSRKLGGGGWPEGSKEGRGKDKEELVDAYLVEQLRKDIGDPFQEALPKVSR